MKILDCSAGNRAVWFNKKDPRCLYLDKRREVNPDIVCDTTEMPEAVGEGYNLIVFDPPHVSSGPNSNMSAVYGHHKLPEIIRTIEGTEKEAWRVSATGALLALKWNDHDIPLRKVMMLMPHWEPLFGHITKDGPGSKTYWVLMLRRDEKVLAPETKQT